VITDSTPFLESEGYIMSTAEIERDFVFGVYNTSAVFGVTFVQLLFTLSLDQAKTLTEKRCYFLRHGNTCNFEKMLADDAKKFADDVKRVGNDLVNFNVYESLKYAHEKLNQEYWSKEEIDMYEQEMQEASKSRSEEEGIKFPTLEFLFGVMTLSSKNNKVKVKEEVKKEVKEEVKETA